MATIINNIKEVYDNYSINMFAKGWSMAVRYADNKKVKYLSGFAYPILWSYGIGKYVATNNR